MACFAHQALPYRQSQCRIASPHRLMTERQRHRLTQDELEAIYREDDATDSVARTGA